MVKKKVQFKPNYDFILSLIIFGFLLMLIYGSLQLHYSEIIPISDYLALDVVKGSSTILIIIVTIYVVNPKTYKDKK